jgi:hypothetical protein
MSKDDEDFELREARTKASLLEQAKRAIAVRSKDREFHGLEREFLYLQSEMLLEFEKSKDIRHPRDVGDAREEILRKFLKASGYLPARFAVSESRARVASTTGHVTGEMDIVFYDPIDSISLMRRDDIYEVLPVESVYGVIQIKSRLNKKEIKLGLENIAAFKRLDRQAQPSPFVPIPNLRSARGFGILFAYDSDLKWLEIIREIEVFAKAHPHQEWCNAIVVLSKGMFLYGDGTGGKYSNEQIASISELQMHGYPDRQSGLLFQFYSILIALLRMTTIQLANPDSYFRLPLVSDELSYEFQFGQFAELARCDKHGDYQRKISRDNLRKITDWCRNADPINWIKATHLAYGEAGDDEEAYWRQPGDVRIYNPDNLALTDILVMDSEFNGLSVKSLAFDTIRTAGMTIYVPYYYTMKEGIISACPKCPRLVLPVDGTDV